MERILIMREKYLSSVCNVEQMREVIGTSKSQLIRQNRDIKDRYIDELERLSNLRSKVAHQQEGLASEEQKLNSMVNELANHNDMLKELELEKNRLLLENDEIQLKRDQLRVVKPSTTDQKILESGRKKFDYYKVLTGIRWDYAKLKTSATGFVTNGDDYIHPFSYDFADKRLESKLWREIEKSTNYHEIRQSEYKENFAPNDF